MKRSVKFLFVFLTLVTLVACGGGATAPAGDGDGDGDGDGGGGDGDGTTVSCTIFPYDLVIFSPVASGTPQQQPSQNKAFGLVLDIAENNQDFTAKKEDLTVILEGDSIESCGFNMALFAGGGQSVNCYGPSLQLEGNPHDADGTGGGDAGIWDEYNGDEACAAAQTNALVNAVSGTVDMAVNSFAAMLCVINNTEGMEVPEAGGDPLDVATALQDALEGNGITELTIDTATLEHQADDADGNDVCFFTLIGSATYEGETRNITLYLKHIPLDADNETYKGKLSYAFTDDSGNNAGNCNNDTVGENKTTTTVEAGSILYYKESSTNLTYRLQTGKFCDSSHMPLDVGEDGNYDINPADSASPENPTGYANGFKYYIFNMNPTVGTGDFAFAWAAGTGGENLRTLNLSIANLEDGKGGCAYFGYGPQAATEGAVLGDIDGFVCNWGIGGEPQPFHDLVQRQCVSLDEETQKYETDEDLGTLAIKYAPTETCEVEAEDGFTYNSSNGSEGDPASNDRYDDADAVDHELIDIADRDFTVPEVPDDVY